MKKDIVCFSGINWNFLRMRHHHLMEGLAQNNNVLFINASLGPGVEETREMKAFGTIKKQRGILTLYTPWSITRKIRKLIGIRKLLRPISNYLLKSYIRSNFPHPILWCTRPENLVWLGKLDERLICYDCLDDYAAFDDIKPSRKKKLLRMERELAKRADMVFATAQQLYQRMEPLNKNTFLLKNGADFEHFNQATRKLNIPEDLKRVPRPIAGYIGVVAYWLDYELIDYLVKKNEDISFVFIGPISVDLSRFDGYKNIYFLSKKEYEELPLYLSHFDACLIPFQANDVAKSTNPVKLYEYLSAGKPVISTKLPELFEYKNVVTISSSKQEFDQALKESLININPSLENERIKVAMENIWTKRVETLEALLNQALAK